jgi:hypothetical protein
MSGPVSVPESGRDSGRERRAVTGPRLAFEYAVLRAVPRVDRGECVNVGVVLYCQGADYLGAAVHVDPDRLRLLDPAVDVDAVRASLAGICAVCAGAPDAGPLGTGSTRVRFGRLTAPRSTVVQPGAIHGGLTSDPADALDRLLTRLVR